MKNWLTTGLGRLRLITLLEGISWLVLLFVAMPLKYFFDQPEWTKMVGSAHGALFVLFVMLLMKQSMEYNWKFSRSLLLFLSSLVPFGFIYADKRLLKEN
ncbi:DUF3817 domain-containing protein [bacterium SCSIO 12741]|nr:DUF3817 domain-containing protein [bacterium SCSIO 12741]